MPPPPPMRRALRLSLLAALAAPLLAHAQPGAWARPGGGGPPLYETGFEEFTPGSIADQHGWVGINGRFTVETVGPAEGAQHFRGTSSGLAWSFARSPFVTGSANLSVVSALVRVGTTTPAATWEFTPGIANEGGITTVRINPDRSIDVLVASAVPEGTFVPTGASFPPGYVPLEVEVDNATGAFRVFLDGVSIATGQGVRVGAIGALIVYSDMEAGTAGHTFDMDDFALTYVMLVGTEATPGAPHTAALTMAGPTPFRGRTHLALRAAESQPVTVALYDALGRRVAVLFDGRLEAGRTQPIAVDGAALAPGLYVARATGATFAAARRVVRAE